jgi:ABC-2 type transport system ATP-binding protein
VSATVAAIDVEDLTKYYGRSRGVEDLTFAVRPGEVFGFLGPNGAGKTTTIRTVLDLIRPTSGRVRVLGLDSTANASEIHARVGYVPGEFGLYERLTGAQYLQTFAALRGGAGAERIDPLASRLDLDTSVRIRELSHGNRRKVGLVQAFMHEPDLFVLDEPTQGLDPLMQQEFHAMIEEAQGRGATVFLSSHVLPEVERICDRVAIIREGRLVEVTTVSDLAASHWRSMSLVLAEPPPPGLFELPNVQVASASARDVHLMVQGDVNPLLRRLATIDVQDLTISPLEIEDVFLRLYAGGGDEGSPR